MSKSKTPPVRRAKIVQVVVHGQGSTNAEWEIIWSDGWVDEYYSTDGDFPKHKTTDQPIAKERESFGKTLMELWGVASFEKDPEDEGLSYSRKFSGLDYTRIIAKHGNISRNQHYTVYDITPEVEDD